MDEFLGTWRLVQFTPDLRRREPRNVGVVLRAPDGWHFRFLHTDLDGAVDSRTPRDLPREPYLAWVDYFKRKMNDDAWQDVERALARRGGNFSVVPGGHLLEQPRNGWDVETQMLFDTLIGERTEPDSHKKRLRAVVRTILDRAQLDVTTDFRTPALFGREAGTATFDFAHQNGRLHLMKAVPLGGNGAENRALAFNARVRAAKDAAPSQGLNFFAFFDSEVVEDVDVLAPVQGVASAIDVRDESRAVDALLTAIYH